METQSFTNFLTVLFSPPAAVPVGEVRVCVPSGPAVAHARGCRSAAIAPRLDFILPGGHGAGTPTAQLGWRWERGRGEPAPRGGRDGVVWTLHVAKGWGVLCHVLPPVFQTVLVPEFVITTSTESYVDLMGKTTLQSGILREDTMSSTLLTG